MTTTDLIKLLQRIEQGASGRPREVSLLLGNSLFCDCEFSVDSTGDGVAGAEVTLQVTFSDVQEID